jgi:hypothetical protein
MLTTSQALLLVLLLRDRERGPLRPGGDVPACPFVHARSDGNASTAISGPGTAAAPAAAARGCQPHVVPLLLLLLLHRLQDRSLQSSAGAAPAQPPQPHAT